MRNTKAYGIFLFICITSFFFTHAQGFTSEDSGSTEECEEPEEAEVVGGKNSKMFDDSCWYCAAGETDCEYARRRGLTGIWLPETPQPFRPFIADPRQVTYSVGWRFNDEMLGKNLVDVSYGESLPVYRWCNLWYFGGDLQFEIEGALWAVFSPLKESAPLIDADYYVGFPITYVFGDWAIRLRGYHISTHIGDEFLLTHPKFRRRNPSNEYFDLFFSYQFTNDIRLYGGIGWIACQDDSFRVSPFYSETGLELRMRELRYCSINNRLYGEPFLAMNFRFSPEYKHHLDSTYALGYEWGKISGLRRKLRVFLEYHDGYSLEGQFCCFPTKYLSVRCTYGF